jgi:hypothetical protein
MVRVVVQFERETRIRALPSGVPRGQPVEGSGVSRGAAIGKAQRLKPFRIVALAASLKRCLATSLFPNRTTTMVRCMFSQFELSGTVLSPLEFSRP